MYVGMYDIASGMDGLSVQQPVCLTVVAMGGLLSSVPTLINLAA